MQPATTQARRLLCPALSSYREAKANLWCLKPARSAAIAATQPWDSKANKRVHVLCYSGAEEGDAITVQYVSVIDAVIECRAVLIVSVYPAPPILKEIQLFILQPFAKAALQGAM